LLSSNNNQSIMYSININNAKQWKMD